MQYGNVETDILFALADWYGLNTTDFIAHVVSIAFDSSLLVNE